MKKFFIRLFLSIISIVLLCLFFELSAKFLNSVLKIPHGQIDLGVGGLDVLEYPSGYIKDRELFWRLQPSAGEYNSVGFRDREFSFQKDSNSFRIICMGDSVIFGCQTRIEDTFPKILEKLLNSQFPKKKFEVFNAGVPGYTSYQGLVWLQKEIIKYHPDLIIIYYGINDRAGSYKPDKKQKRLPVLIVRTANYLRRFQFYNLFNKTLLYLKYPPRKEGLYSAYRVSSGDFRDNLLNMKKICEKNGIKILFIVRPVLYDPEKKIVFTDSRYIPPGDILQFDIYSLFKGRESYSDKLFLDDARPFNFHLTTKGQKILAEEMFNFLINNNVNTHILPLSINYDR
jgi:hypothetical protein